MKINLNNQITVHLTAKGLARVLDYYGKSARNYLEGSTLEDVRYTASIWEAMQVLHSEDKIEINERLATMDAELKGDRS